MPRFSLIHDPLLDPPPHVLAEVDAAWERAQDLIAGELELHFTVSSGAARQGVAGELRVPGGEPCASLSATEALLLACGDALVCDERSHALAA